MARNQRKIKPSRQNTFTLTTKKLLIILYISTFILYGRSLLNDYALDDELVVDGNPKIEKGFNAIPEIFTSFYAATDKMQYGYRPIVQLTFAIEYGIFGRNPFMSHLINVLLYAILLHVLFLLLKRIFLNYNVLFPFCITLLFMAHPIHTEVVCSLKNRDELLSFLGGISAVLFLFKYIEHKKIKYFIIANLCLLLGFFAKLSALTFLGIIPLTLYFFTKITIKRNILLSGIMAFFLLSLFYVSRLMLPEAIQPFSITENPLFIQSSFEARFATGMLSLLFYLKLVFIPQPLLFFYGYNTMPDTHFGNSLVWISFIIHAALMAWALYKLKSRHIVAFALLFYFISISMFTNIATPVAGIVGERFAFAAVLGFCIIISYLIFFLGKIPLFQNVIFSKTSLKPILLLAIILALYSFKTIHRNQAWQNRKTLYLTDIEHLEHSAKAQSLTGNILFKEALDDVAARGMVTSKNRALADSAFVYFSQAVKIHPAYAQYWSDMGSIYFTFQRKYDASIPLFKKAIASDTNMVTPYFNVAFAYELTGDTANALLYYKKTLEKDSTYKNAAVNLKRLSDAVQAKP